MKAEEMFEQLGFRKNKSICFDDQYILYEKTSWNDIYTVRFYDNYCMFTDTCNRCLEMPKELIKAIYMQMKELGWVE